MSRLKGVKLWELWRARMVRFEGLGQTVAEFCQWEGVSVAAFYVWRKKLREEESPKGRAIVRGALSAKVNVARHRSLFVPVIPSPNTVAAGALDARCAAAGRAVVVMTLLDGTRIELPADDHPLIAHVVVSVAAAQSVAGSHQGHQVQGGDR